MASVQHLRRRYNGINCKCTPNRTTFLVVDGDTPPERTSDGSKKAKQNPLFEKNDIRHFCSFLSENSGTQNHR